MRLYLYTFLLWELLSVVFNEFPCRAFNVLFDVPEKVNANAVRAVF